MDPAVAVRRTVIAHVILALVVAVVVGAVLALVGLGLAWVVLVALVVGVGASVGLHYAVDAIALSAFSARPLGDGELPGLENLVTGLVVANGFRMPALYVVDDGAPNAAAIGRHPRHSGLVVTTGLVERLRRIELEGVLAHELSRIRSREAMLGVTTGALVRWLPSVMAVAIAARMLEPSVAVRADLAGVALTRYPPGLAGALQAMDADGRSVMANPRAFRHLWINTPDEALVAPEFSVGARIDVLEEL